MTLLTVLIPAYNEEERIADTLRAVRRLAAQMEVLVIDDGSTDHTAAMAEQSGADLVLRVPHAGKGQALQAGYLVAQGDLLLMLDADLGATAAEAERLLHAITEGAADMAIAQLQSGGGKGGGMGLVVKLARFGIRRLTGCTMHTPLSGQRALRRTVLEQTGGFDQGWGAEVALTIKAIRSGCRVIEVPCRMTHRVTGRSAAHIAHRAAQFLAVLRVLVQLQGQLPARKMLPK